MKALEILLEMQYGLDTTGTPDMIGLNEAIGELSQIKSRICCDNCQYFDSRVEICYLNGCKDFEEWTLWKPLVEVK